MTTQPSQAVLINGFGTLFVIFNVFGLGLRLPVGKMLARAFSHWKIVLWALVINFVIIPLLFIGYLLTIADSIPGEIKVGFCIAALCAGMPFAPILAQLAKANVSIATTMLVVLTLGTIIALPIGLPFAVDAVDAQLKPSAWDVAWPLLLFLLLLWFWGAASGSGGPTWRRHWNGGPCELQFCLCSSISTSRCLRIGICSWIPGTPGVTSRLLRAQSSASGAAISSLPVFESKTWESGMRPRRPRRYATSLRCSL
jgi:sodium bile acid symporter family protein